MGNHIDMTTKTYAYSWMWSTRQSQFFKVIMSLSVTYDWHVDDLISFGLIK